MFAFVRDPIVRKPSARKPGRHYFAVGVVVSGVVFFGGVVVFVVAAAGMGLAVAGAFAGLAAGTGVLKAALLTTEAGVALGVRCDCGETAAGCPETRCRLFGCAVPLT